MIFILSQAVDELKFSNNVIASSRLFLSSGFAPMLNAVSFLIFFKSSIVYNIIGYFTSITLFGSGFDGVCVPG
jgi:hypothetical protein